MLLAVTEAVAVPGLTLVPMFEATSSMVFKAMFMVTSSSSMQKVNIKEPYLSQLSNLPEFQMDSMQPIQCTKSLLLVV